jgi:hypothetical protein
VRTTGRSLEPFAHLDVAREPSMAHAPRECTAVAAVEEQHDPARSAPAHLHVDELGRQSGRRQVARLGVGRGEVERPVFVLDAVTGEM